LAVDEVEPDDAASPAGREPGEEEEVRVEEGLREPGTLVNVFKLELDELEETHLTALPSIRRRSVHVEEP
jgi:hypothetical protein